MKPSPGLSSGVSRDTISLDCCGDWATLRSRQPRKYVTEYMKRPTKFAPRSGDISEPPRRICVVREVRQPPSHGFRGQARVRFAPAVDQSVAGIVLRQAQAFLMKVHKQSRRRCDFVTMSQQQGIVSRIVEISCQQRKGKAELCDLRPTHVVHACGVHEIAEE